ncbi:peptidyl-prolyl cis-trans isomerase NIMA-interacting 1-like protein [Linderina pennispora]|uniref:Peptidyl-prolyl cis-trans isomerase n=1 Tax=Linderina pennispora TaxID=61395 RepID=A0A1Y1WC75_9FUNG|nr:peptidyl-prolyl cis-trans isomerase NIMA-interacting 1-like protein [Linderina pennispora]ORX71139.1 peptidyl-prolyl cis-trans isomerase NIMA-interacting 1-like protein [Linderina pennispora]
MSKSRGIEYYFNRTTGESRWEPPTEEPRARTTKMRASHLLVKHAGSRKPSSWKEANITRTKQEATAAVEQFREQIASGQVQFADLAAKESDCSSARRGGDLGWFDRGQMQPAFEKAVLALKPGELSGPVESDSGVHIILRTG